MLVSLFTCGWGPKVFDRTARKQRAHRGSLDRGQTCRPQLLRRRRGEGRKPLSGLRLGISSERWLFPHRRPHRRTDNALDKTNRVAAGALLVERADGDLL